MVNDDDLLSLHPAQLRQLISQERAENARLRAIINTRGLRYTDELRMAAATAMRNLLCPIVGLFEDNTGNVCACIGLCDAHARMLIKAIEDAGLIIAAAPEVKHTEMTPATGQGGEA